MDLLYFLAGLALLLLGARILVEGASRLAAAAGISPLVVGLTVVAFGTSTLELAVSIDAAVQGRGDIALGNVVGSNILNVLLILGLSALIAPLAVSRRLVRFEVPLMVALSFAVYLLALDGSIGRIEGAVLVLLLLGFVYWSYRVSRREPDGSETSARAGAVVAGLVLLVLGARWLVDSAATFARAVGVSELVIGLTVVAAGTSLPEIATSVIAAARGARDVAVGNVVGSNLFNILGVLGIAAAIVPGGIAVAPAVLHFDIPVMLAAAIACLPIFFTARRIDRWEGALFFGYYLAYTGYVVLDATGHDTQEPFGAVMLWFVMPLTAVTLGVLALRARGAEAVRLREPGSGG